MGPEENKTENSKIDEVEIAASIDSVLEAAEQPQEGLMEDINIWKCVVEQE